MKNFLLFFLLLGLGNVFGDDPKLILRYLPNVEETYQLNVFLSCKQNLLGQPLEWEGEEKALFSLTLFGEQSDLPIIAPPFDLKLVLKNLEAKVYLKDVEKTLLLSTSSKEEDNPWLAQIKRLIARPIYLRYHTNDMTAPLIQERHLPLAQTFPSKEIVKEIFEPLFGLIGKEIKQDASFERKLSNQNIFYPSLLSYHIQEVTKESITAQFKGKIPLKEYTLQEKTSLSFSGALEGTVRWQRKNALIASFLTTYKGEGFLSALDRKSPIQIFATVELIPHADSGR